MTQKKFSCLYVLSQIRPTGDSAANDQIKNVSVPTEIQEQPVLIILSPIHNLLFLTLILFQKAR